MSSNYKSAVHRINNANNSGDLEQLINSFTNLYNLGILTESEYQRLDIKIVDKLDYTTEKTLITDIIEAA